MRMDSVGTHTAREGLSALAEVWTLQKPLLCVSGEEEPGDAAAPAIKGASIGPLLCLGVFVDSSPCGNPLNRKWLESIRRKYCPVSAFPWVSTYSCCWGSDAGLTWWSCNIIGASSQLQNWPCPSLGMSRCWVGGTHVDSLFIPSHPLRVSRSTPVALGGLERGAGAHLPLGASVSALVLNPGGVWPGDDWRGVHLRLAAVWEAHV